MHGRECEKEVIFMKEITVINQQIAYDVIKQSYCDGFITFHDYITLSKALLVVDPSTALAKMPEYYEDRFKNGKNVR